MSATIPKDKLKNGFLILLLIASCFLLTGSGYLSWLYNLMDAETNSTFSNKGILENVLTNIDILTEVIGYFFQVVGLFISFILINKGISKRNFSILIICDLAFIILSMQGRGFGLVLFAGYLMNTMHGIIAGYYLACLCRIVTFNRIGIIFGTGYAIGTIGTWIVSLINGGEFLKNSGVIFVYVALTVASIVIINSLLPLNGVMLEAKNETIDGSNGGKNIQKNNITLIAVSGVVVVLLSLVKGLGFYFPMADISNGEFSLEFVRIFYAVGLIVAGIVNDLDYRWGRALCISGLVLPFVLISLSQNQIGSMYLWIISYSITGFYTVYRIVIMAGYGYYQRDNSKLCIPIIIFGLIGGRIGDSIGSLVGILLSDKPVILILTGAILYAVTIFMVFVDIRTNKTNTLQYETYTLKNDINTSTLRTIHESEDMSLDIKREYQISDREYEVLLLILKGYTNGKISSELYITENTVKFHVKNILKKMGCSNRKELSSMINK